MQIFVCASSEAVYEIRAGTPMGGRVISTIKMVACCVALRSRVVKDATGASVRAKRLVKRL
ncbi:hypothetical protein [Ferruginibacter sp.]|uniref:hypothetical protein n=1 Tax=Ferruginibacter sp. TaxID=1940288 RepID=UPI002657B331|nr:hypothetical protein [Ferruginibacter sp.]